jgi:hypothetical protein
VEGHEAAAHGTGRERERQREDSAAHVQLHNADAKGRV